MIKTVPTQPQALPNLPFQPRNVALSLAPNIPALFMPSFAAARLRTWRRHQRNVDRWEDSIQNYFDAELFVHILSLWQKTLMFWKETFLRQFLVLLRHLWKYQRKLWVDIATKILSFVTETLIIHICEPGKIIVYQEIWMTFKSFKYILWKI